MIKIGNGYAPPVGNNYLDAPRASDGNDTSAVQAAINSEKEGD